MAEEIDGGRRGLVKKRRLNEAELAEVEELAQVCDAYEDLHLRLSVEQMRTRTGKESNDFLFYEDGRLVGALALSDYGKEKREVILMVHPYHRRRGIASALLAAARKDARRRGIERLALVCERFSRSGNAFIGTVGAQYDFSEHHMELREFKERGDFSEQLRLVRAVPTDVGEIARVTAASFGESEERIKPHIAKDIAAPERQYYIAKLGEEVVGTFNLYITGESTGIYAFAVAPRYRRRGFGRQMLEQIIRQIRAESSKRITLEVETTNTNAIALYQSTGFRPVTTYGYYELEV
ncbi:MAG TPA: GNAT family N-acetyltransferase [Ktedonobacteraceae bacterium]|nr:GNAT family N-acetyltransferase [Ktedonobacteraceae bacterium]